MIDKDVCLDEIKVKNIQFYWRAKNFIAVSDLDVTIKNLKFMFILLWRQPPKKILKIIEK